MTETLHPFDDASVAAWVRVVAGGEDPEAMIPGGGAWAARLAARARQGYTLALGGSEPGANALTFGLAQALSTRYPVFVLPGASLTPWEARIDRGAGMLLRPPARMFGDAGLASPAARAMPIRLDPSMSMMGGSHVPARLVPQLKAQLEEREAKLLRRMIEAEMDAVPIYSTLLDAVTYAAERGLGLFEAVDVIVPEAPEATPPGAVVIVPDRKRMPKDLRHRLDEAAKPPKPPGLLSRLLGRSRGADAPPGFGPDHHGRGPSD
ncbi:MAG: hypothetical protein ACR2J8_10710 [Thermomicrobiales bacterium]